MITLLSVLPQSLSLFLISSYIRKRVSKLKYKPSPNKVKIVPLESARRAEFKYTIGYTKFHIWKFFSCNFYYDRPPLFKSAKNAVTLLLRKSRFFYRSKQFSLIFLLK